MDYNISNHPIDATLIRDRLVPFIMGDGEIDDLIDRAVEVGRVARESARWAEGLMQLELTISEQQREIAPRRVIEYQVPDPDAEPTGRWMNKQVPMVTRKKFLPGVITGIPLFDPDLLYFGRPFLISARTTDDVLTLYERYLETDPDDAESLESLILEAFDHLEQFRSRIRTETAPEVVKIVRRYYPLADHVELLEKEEDSSPDELRNLAGQALFLLREAYRQRNRNTPIELPDSRKLAPKELLAYAPLELIDFSARLLPGWRGEGEVWPTALFKRIKVDVSHIFEKPTALFEPLLKEIPELADRLQTTIPGNNSLGGYVPPEKMQAFVDELVKHKWELVLAWEKSDEEQEKESVRTDEWTSDCQKIIEPATYALRNDLGFLEAAEVYSGPFEWMN